MAAVQIQRVYRGHRGRLQYQIKKQLHMAEMAEENDAATKIQQLFRNRRARAAMEQARDVKKQKMIYNARIYVEFWDDDACTYFYFNAETAEALWEPPDSGYTKADGRLVLESGETIEDPDLDPKDADDAEKKMCIECETEEADKFCHQCNDNYCNSCFLEKHSTGKRKEHTFDQIGPIRCIEGEIERATKMDWCDDPYCDDCFKKFHSKGNKAKQKFKPIEEAIKEKKAKEEAAKTWVQFFDEDNGYPYW